MIITFLIAPTEGKCHPTELLIPRSYRNPTRGEFDIGMVGHANFAIKIPPKQIETAAHWIFIDGIRE